MAAPASALKYTIAIRDSKGRVARTRVVVGGATVGATFTSAQALVTHLQAIVNGFVWLTVAAEPQHTYGTVGRYDNAEDKAVMTFLDPTGGVHRFSIATPILNVFLADQETVNPAQAGVAAVISDFATFVYGRDTDTAPLAFVGGSRARRRMQRKLNIFVKDPTLTEPAE